MGSQSPKVQRLPPDPGGSGFLVPRMEGPVSWKLSPPALTPVDTWGALSCPEAVSAFKTLHGDGQCTRWRAWGVKRAWSGGIGVGAAGPALGIGPKAATTL